MAGPLVFWPNRKSKNGSRRRVSKVPRDDQRTFYCDPPIASREYMMRSVMFLNGATGEMAGAMKAVSEALDAKDIEAAYVSAERLFKAGTSKCAALADELASVKKVQEAIENELAAVDNEAHWIRGEVERLAEENKVKTEALRVLQKERDPDAIKLQIMYAVDEATAAKDQELREARSEIATLKSEVDELKRAKKRLREALAKLSEK